MSINKIKLDYVSPGDTFRLMSDLHYGFRWQDRDLIRSELADAVSCGHRVLVNGDLFDAIVPGDRRYSPSEVHPDLAGRDDQLDAAMDWFCEDFDAVAAKGLLDWIGTGNHELTILRSGGTLPTATAARRLGVRHGGYSTLLRLPIDGSKPRQHIDIYAHHGPKKGGAATSMKRLTDFVDAAVIWVGHYHNAVSTGQLRIDGAGCREVRQVMTGAYISAYAPMDTYASVAGYRPGLMGGALLRVVRRHDGSVGVEVTK